MIKKIFPAFWFGFLIIFVVTAALSGAAESSLSFVIIPVVMAIFGFFLMKKLVWDLADEVYDGGDYLLIKNRGVEDHVDLSNIMNVSASTAVNPPRVTMRLVKRGKFGDEISFSPQTGFRINPFAKIAVAEDLIVRVDKARLRRAL